jgi:hypothetical protein
MRHFPTHAQIAGKKAQHGYATYDGENETSIDHFVRYVYAAQSPVKGMREYNHKVRLMWHGSP